jgi:hypothetical protein
VDLFVELHSKEPDTASAVFDLARPYLLTARKFAICSAYVDAERDFDGYVKRYRTTMDGAETAMFKQARIDFAEDMFQYEAASLIALLGETGKKDQAASIAKQAKKVMENEAKHSVFDAAVEGKFPKQYP